MTPALLRQWRNARRLFAAPAPGPGEAARLRAAMSLLATPLLDGEAAGALQRLLDTPGWAPPRLPESAHRPLRFLLASHAHTLGVPLEALFRDAPCPTPREVRRHGILFLRRQKALGLALEALQAGGIGRCFLVKGAAVAPYYAEPPARLMSDVDLVVPPTLCQEAARVLRGAGFIQGPRHTSEIFVHPTIAASIDLHTTSEELFAVLEGECSPVASGGGWQGARLLPPALQFLVLAAHAAKHAGATPWRDVADARALLAAMLPPGPGPHALPAGLAHWAGRLGLVEELDALLGLVRWAGGPLLPPCGPVTGRTRRLARLYRQLALEPVNPEVIRFAGKLGAPPGELATAAWAALRRQLSPGAAPVGEALGDPQVAPPGDARFRQRDFGLGLAMPPAASPRTQRLKVLVIAAMVSSPRARQLLPLVRERAALSQINPWPFRPAT